MAGFWCILAMKGDKHDMATRSTGLNKQRLADDDGGPAMAPVSVPLRRAGLPRGAAWSRMALAATVLGMGVSTAYSWIGRASAREAGDSTTIAPPAAPGGPGSCAAEPLRGTGTTYYYCDCQPGAAPGCVAGNDASPGISPSAPRRSGLKERFATMAAGSTVALCRGGSFVVPDTPTRNPYCRAAKTCDMRDYVAPWNNGSEGRPIISGGRLGHFPDNAAHYEGFRFFNLEASKIQTGQGNFLAGGNTTDVDICNVHFHDGDLAVYWADPSPGNLPPARWTLRQSKIERMGGGILGGCTDCVVDGNYFANTSYTANSILHHPLYVSGANVLRMRITNNEIHGCAPGTSTGTVLLVVHGQHEELLIENNLVQCDNGADGHGYGISMDNGSYTNSVPGYERRTIIRRNRVINAGEFGIAVSQAPDSIVEDNVVIMPAGSNGSIAIVAGNILRRGPPNDDPANDRITIRNNTIYYPTSSPQHRLVGIGIVNEGTGHVVANNVIYFAASGPSECFRFPLVPSAYSLLSNNACNGTWSTTHDANRVALRKSPFADAARGDFTPAEKSPLVKAGTTASYSRRAIGTVRWSAADPGTARDPPVDIGAYQ